MAVGEADNCQLCFKLQATPGSNCPKTCQLSYWALPMQLTLQTQRLKRKKNASWQLEKDYTAKAEEKREKSMSKSGGIIRYLLVLVPSAMEHTCQGYAGGMDTRSSDKVRQE